MTIQVKSKSRKKIMIEKSSNSKMLSTLSRRILKP